MNLAYVSPSTKENSTLADALRDAGAQELLQSHGAQPGIGFWKDGAEASGVFTGENSSELLHRVAQLAKSWRQKSFIAFSEQKHGADLAHIIRSPESDPHKLDKELTKAGVEFKTIVKHPYGTVIHALDQGGQLEHGLRQWAQKSGAKVRTLHGRIHFVGADDRDSAQAEFDRVIHGEKNAGPVKLARIVESRTNPEALKVAQAYAAKSNLPPLDGNPSTLTKDPGLGARVARVYARLPNAPQHPAVKRSYDALKSEVAAQYQHLVDSGVKMTPWVQPGQPYANSAEMRADVAKNKHLSYFPTDSGYGQGEDASNHPLMETAPNGLKYNDMFRAVHDYFGHAVHGHEFGPQRELRAWHEHAKMFSPTARPALTMETHGQNSWVNYGPRSQEPVQTRPFAEQKANILPEKLQPVKLARKAGENPAFAGWTQPLNEARLKKSLKQYLADRVHDHFADYLEERSDPRSLIVRNRMSPKQAAWNAATTDSGHNRELVTKEQTRIFPRGDPDNRWHWAPAPVVHQFGDGTKLAVMVHQDLDADQGRKFHVAWDGPAKRWYNTVMSPQEFHEGFLQHFPERDRAALSLTYQNNPHTQYDPPEEDHEPARLARKTAFRTDSPSAALATSYSVNNDKRREIAQQILKEAGLAPAAVRTALLHEQGKGVKSTVLTAIQKRIDPGLAKYVASWFGMLSREKALTVFHPHESGQDRLHVLQSSLPVEQMGEYMNSAGVPKFLLEEAHPGSRAYVYSPGGQLDAHVQRVVGGSNARHSQFSGTGFRLGSGEGSDADARSNYRKEISSFESDGAGPAPDSTGPTS